MDLIRWAKEHRFRVRNLHDGLPCPPCLKRDAQKATCASRRATYSPRSDASLAIVGKHGWIAESGPNLSFYCGEFKSRRAANNRRKQAEAIPGLTIDQLGDWEFAGTAPRLALWSVLDLIRATRRRAVTDAMRERGRRLAGVVGPRNAEIAPERRSEAG